MRSIDYLSVFNQIKSTKNIDKIKILKKDFKDDVYNIILNNKNHFIDSLSNGQRPLLDSYLKNKDIHENTFAQFLLFFNEKLEKALFNKILKRTFANKDIINDALNGQLDENKIVDDIVVNNNESIFKSFCTLFDVLFESHFYSLVDEKKKNLRVEKNKTKANVLFEENKKIKELESKAKIELKKLKNDYEKLKRKSEANAKKAKEDIAGLNAKLSKKEEDLKQKDEYLKQKDREIKDKDKEIQNLKEVSNNTKIEDENLSKKRFKINDDEFIPTDVITQTLEDHQFIGTVRLDGIQIQDHNWVIVDPNVSILPNAPYIDKNNFRQEVDYRSDYSTFLVFNDINFRNKVVPDVLSFRFRDANEKNAILYDRLIGKTIVFKPLFKKVDESQDNKLKLNALITDIVDFGDFANAIFIPYIDMSKKQFEEAIKNNENLELKNFPITIASSLKYVITKDGIYEIDYIPGFPDEQNVFIWKQNSNICTKISNRPIDFRESTENYIVIRDEDGDRKILGLYFKKSSLLEYKSKEFNSFDEKTFLKDVLENAANKNLCYSADDIKNFHVAIKSSRLVILAGPSGIGKTRLPLLYSSTLGLENTKNSVLFLPISPSYLEPEDILGYLKPLQKDETNDKMMCEYVESSSSLVSFLIDASRNPDNIYFVIFDEMNLSQIEHWFAPFLSILENDSEYRNLALYSNNNEVVNGDYPPNISIRDNVFFVGTVNIDETTKSLSDRLLDRAIVVNLKKSSFNELKEMNKPESVKKYPERKYSEFSKAISCKENYISEFSDRELEMFQKINDLLLSSALHKGISFRTMKKMSFYLSNSNNVFDKREDALDYCLMEMIISRINGSREELSEVFQSNDRESGLYGLLLKYTDILGDFSRTKELLEKKVSDIELYGYTS